ncbi:MAG: septal ring lytic transglycosylase RlpA family protein [Hyphomonadaceae bacterium]
MAGRLTFRVAAFAGALPLALAMSLIVSGPSLAQATIEYKSAPKTIIPRLELRSDMLSLSVAPHAPIPSFSNAAPAGALDLRPGAPKATFGPTPLAASGASEPLTARKVAPVAVAPFAGPPYEVAGRWYVPAHEPNYNEVGTASWYGPTFHGKASASGERFNENDLTAAHPTLPIPSLVRVTNVENGKAVVVRLNDRGPFVDDRIIDLSKAAGAALDMHAKGTAKVRVEYVGPAPADGGGEPTVATQPQRVDMAMRSLPPIVVNQVAVKPVSGFYLQAGAFSDLGNARALRGRLAGAGPLTIETVQVNGAALYRVMLGPWASRDGVEAARRTLDGPAAKAIVVARNG